MTLSMLEPSPPPSCPSNFNTAPLPLHHHCSCAGGGGVESEFGMLDFKYSRHNVTGSTEKPVQQELHR
jgi:hypothetical protein